MPTQTNGILSKQVKANWRGAFENEMRKAEKAIIGSVRRFYQSEYEKGCLLYTSPSPRDRTRSRMPSSA